MSTEKRPSSVPSEEQAAFRFVVQNLGCKCNRYEADAVALYFKQQGGVEIKPGEEADIALLNTCTVTGEAGRKSCQNLRRLRREHPHAVVAVMGCHSQIEDLSDICDLQTGTHDRLGLAQACIDLLMQRRGVFPEDEAGHFLGKPIGRARHYEELGAVSEQTETRAQIKIAEGCEQFCTYCAICLARGRVLSRSREGILKEARALVEHGHHELVITGTHICSFEREKGRDSLALIELLEELDQIEGLARLRLGSLEPASLTPAFIERLGRLRSICPHFHLSLQSGSDTVLERMHRNYNSARYREIVRNLREVFDEPGLSTDMMVAFPLETEEEFRQSCDFAEEIAFSRIHVFRYSPRAHTPAARMPQIDPAVSKKRGEELQAIADRLAASAAASRVGKEELFIAEQPSKQGFDGYTARYYPSLLRQEKDAPAIEQGACYRCRVEASEDDRLILKALERVFD